MFSYLADTIIAKKKRVLILCHRDELVDQISRALAQFRVRHTFCVADQPYDSNEHCIVGSVFTVAKRLDRILEPDIIIIDEAHHAILGSSWGKVMEAFPRAWKLGVTATPQRLGGEALSDLFDDMIVGPTTADLIKIGKLSPFKVYAPTTIDTSTIGKRGGDFIRSALATICDKPTITGSAVKEYQRLAPGRRAVAFCVSIEHAMHVAAEFRAAGISAKHIDGKMDKVSRRALIEEFRHGDLKVLTSCEVLGEGLDVPSIEVGIMLRPTQSLTLWLQQCGRVLRIAPKKEIAIIIDHSGNCLRLGLPDDEREWTLDGRYTNPKAASETPPTVRICPECFAAVRAVPKCLYCGHEFIVKSREVEEVDGELEEVDSVALKVARKQEQWNAKTFEQLVALGKERGYKNPNRWAYFIHESRKKKGY